MPQPNAAGAPQHHPLQPLHFSVGRLPPTIDEREKLDLIEERLRAIEGIGDYPFTDMAELCLVPDVIILPKFKVPDFDKYAQRWRDLAAQVAPPMMEREMITMIVDTLPVFFYEKMVGDRSHT